MENRMKNYWREYLISQDRVRNGQGKYCKKREKYKRNDKSNERSHKKSVMILLLIVLVIYSSWIIIKSLKKGHTSISLGFTIASLLLGLGPLILLYISGKIPSYDLPVKDLIKEDIELRAFVSITVFNLIYSTRTLLLLKNNTYRINHKFRMPYKLIEKVSYIFTFINTFIVLRAINGGLNSDSHWTNIRGDFNPLYSIIDLATKICIALPAIIQIYEIYRPSQQRKNLIFYHGCFIPPIILMLTTGNRFFLLIPILLVLIGLYEKGKTNLPLSLAVGGIFAYPILLIFHSFSIIRAKIYFAESPSEIFEIVLMQLCIG